MKKSQFYYWIIIVAFSFGFYAKSYSNKVCYSSEAFEIPSTKNAKNSTHRLLPQTTKSFQFLYPTFLGKMKFNEEFAIQPDWLSITSTGFEAGSKGSIDRYDMGGIQLFAVPDILMRDPMLGQENKSAFFPMFVVNETAKTKVIVREKLHIETIHEARDSNGLWRPIGKTHLGMTGRRVWLLNLHPQEYATFLIPLYQGNYATELRVCLKNGDNLLFSNLYSGNINYDQFSFRKDW